MDHYRRSAAVALLGLACFVAASASAQADKIDDYIKTEMQRHAIPGLSLAVVRDGEIVKAKGYGLSNVELNVAAGPETIYQSGSVGKQFTATLVMMLVEEGKLGLDDPVGKYIPEAPASWQKITLRHLLSHTSGISNSLYQKIDMHRDYTEDELIREIVALPLDFQPGDKFNYSNPGYVTLGILVHKVTGKFYGDLLREKIFEPLGMTTARIINEADIIPNRAAGYRLVDGALKNQEWVSPLLNTTADGALYLTVLDMAKWDAGLASEKLLKRASLDRMWAPTKLNDGTTVPYGFGWEPGERRGHRFIAHGGGWQGFSTHIVRYLDKKLTVIVLTNLAFAPAGTIANGVAGLSDPEVAPIEHVAVHIDPKSFAPFTGEYEFAPGIVFAVSSEGDKLWLQTPGQPRQELLAESETSFFLQGMEALFTFVKDASGKVTHVILHQGGFDREMKKSQRARSE